MATSDELQALLNLPFGALAIIGSGYIGYRIAFTGKDKTHATIDVIFLSFVFAALAKFASGSLRPSLSTRLPPAISEILVAVVSLLVVIFAAALWRRFGEFHVFSALRRLKVSHSDRYHTAWETITLRSGVYPSQLIVRKKDGSSLMSEKLSDFSEAPFGPCVFGSDGSIALYVTDFKSLNSDWEKTVDGATPDWGQPITYVAASEISEIEVRMAR
jgi:hypothetical protein